MFYYDTNLKFKGATLLYADEASNLLTEQERKYRIEWWLRTPGNISDYVCYVHGNGCVHYIGSPVRSNFGIRPALQICNMGGFNVGDIFSIGKYYFKIISPELAWMYNQEIGSSIFDRKYNYYMGSHIKNIVDAWYKDELSLEMK